MKYMPRSVWGVLWLLNLVQRLGCFCLLMDIFALAVNKEHFPVGTEQFWGYGGDKFPWPLAPQVQPPCSSARHSVIVVGIAELGSSFKVWDFLFSPTVCPCHVLASLCHFEQLCVCQAGFSQQLCDKEGCFAKLGCSAKVGVFCKGWDVSFLSLSGGSKGSCSLIPCR